MITTEEYERMLEEEKRETVAYWKEHTGIDDIPEVYQSEALTNLRSQQVPEGSVPSIYTELLTWVPKDWRDALEAYTAKERALRNKGSDANRIPTEAARQLGISQASYAKRKQNAVHLLQALHKPFLTKPQTPDDIPQMVQEWVEVDRRPESPQELTTLLQVYLHTRSTVQAARALQRPTNWALTRIRRFVSLNISPTYTAYYRFRSTTQCKKYANPRIK